jgi:hypothetical protein
MIAEGTILCDGVETSCPKTRFWPNRLLGIVEIATLLPVRLNAQNDRIFYVGRHELGAMSGHVIFDHVGARAVGRA